jgi:outer membrane usher protein
MKPAHLGSAAALDQQQRWGALLRATGLLAIALAAPAHAAEDQALGPVAALPAGGTGPYSAGLEVFINGEPTGQVVEVVIDASGNASEMRAGDLRNLRVPIAREIANESLVPLHQVGGLGVTYDAPGQAVLLTIASKSRTPVKIDVTEEMRADPLTIRRESGFLFNYELYGGIGSGSFFNGQTEARLFSGSGALSVSMLGSTQNPGGGTGRITRLDTSWRYVDPVSNRSYAAGDFTTSSPSWASSYRLGGIQIQTAYSLRPDIVTSALPQFSGTAEVPSTVELFVNDSKIYAGQVPSGPFSLQRLPQITGGNIRLITRDVNGNERSIQGAFYYSPSLLRAGLLDYSIAVGALRYSYGEKSHDYGNLAGVASARYGLTDNQTIEAHGEAASQFFNLGLSLGQRLGGIGLFQASGSVSKFGGKAGGRFSLEFSSQIGRFSAHVSTERRSASFFDLGRFSVVRRLQSEPSPSFAVPESPATTRIDRASISFPLPYDRKSNVSLNFTNYRSTSGQSRLLSGSLSRFLGNGFSLWVNGYRDLDRRSLSFNLGIVRSFGGASVLASGQLTDGRAAFEVQAVGASNQRQNSFNWALSNRESADGVSFRSATLGYRFPEAWVQASLQQAGEQQRLTGQLTGSLVAMAGSMVAANRVGDSFVMVRNAGPGTIIRQNAVAIAKSDRNGNALLPDALPFLPTRVELDPTDLPIGWQVDKTERVVVTGWRRGALVDFEARRQLSALVRIMTEQDEPVAPGSIMHLGPGLAVTVGYGGEAWIEAPTRQMRGMVDQGAGRNCNVLLELPASPDPTAIYGPFRCLSVPGTGGSSSSN